MVNKTRSGYERYHSQGPVSITGSAKWSWFESVLSILIGWDRVDILIRYWYGWQSTRTHVNSLHVNSYPCQLVPMSTRTTNICPLVPPVMSTRTQQGRHHMMVRTDICCVIRDVSSYDHLILALPWHLIVVRVDITCDTSWHILVVRVDIGMSWHGYELTWVRVIRWYIRHDLNLSRLAKSVRIFVTVVAESTYIIFWKKGGLYEIRSHPHVVCQGIFLH